MGTWPCARAKGSAYLHEGSKVFGGVPPERSSSLIYGKMTSGLRVQWWLCPNSLSNSAAGSAKHPIRAARY